MKEIKNTRHAREEIPRQIPKIQRGADKHIEENPINIEKWAINTEKYSILDKYSILFRWANTPVNIETARKVHAVSKL